MLQRGDILSRTVAGNLFEIHYSTGAAPRNRRLFLCSKTMTYPMESSRQIHDDLSHSTQETRHYGTQYNGFQAFDE